MADSKSTKKKAASSPKDEEQRAQNDEQAQERTAAAPLTPDGDAGGREQPGDEAAEKVAQAQADAEGQREDELAQAPEREEAPEPEAAVQSDVPDQSEPIHHRANRPASSAAPLEAPEQKDTGKGEQAFVPPQVTNTASGLAAASGEKSRIVRSDTGESPDTGDLFTEVGGDGMVGVKHRLIEHAFAQPYDRKITRLLLSEGSRVIPFHRDRLIAQIKQQQEEDRAEGSSSEQSEGEKDES